jgi:hypothetical protein
MQFLDPTLDSSVVLARAVKDDDREKFTHTNEESIGGLGSRKFKCTKMTITKNCKSDARLPAVQVRLTRQFRWL